MTIGGALSDLDNLLKADDIPCYYKPSIKAVMDTVKLSSSEIPTGSEVLDKIRAEIDQLQTYYDNDYFSENRDSMFKCNDVFEIIDKYKASPTGAESEGLE